MILLIDNYDSFTYNLYQLFCSFGAKVKVARNDKITLKEIARLRPKKIVISPGPGRPKGAGVCLDIIKNFGGKIPMLGVCLGHQAIAENFGGRIVRAKKLMHGKTSKIFHSGEGLFKGVKNPFVATRYHSLVVSERALPKCLEITARADDGAIMGLRHREYPLFGVQFHPESIMTKEGKKIMGNFLRFKNPGLSASNGENNLRI